MTLPLPPLEAADFNAATTAVNAWRGRCLAMFARGEIALTEALARLTVVDPAFALPHLVGKRCAALDKLLATTDDHIRVAARNALAQYCEHNRLRNFLSHGDAKITLARDRSWHAVFTFAEPSSRGCERRHLIIDENEAVVIVQALHRAQQMLVTRMSAIGAKPSDFGMRIGQRHADLTARTCPADRAT